MFARKGTKGPEGCCSNQSEYVFFSYPNLIIKETRSRGPSRQHTIEMTNPCTKAITSFNTVVEVRRLQQCWITLSLMILHQKMHEGLNDLRDIYNKGEPNATQDFHLY